MSLPLEDLEYQRQAVAAVVGVLDGRPKGSVSAGDLFGNDLASGELSPEAILANKQRVTTENGNQEPDAKLAVTSEIHTRRPEFTANEVWLAKDREREALLCLDMKIHPATVDHFEPKANRAHFFICLELALDTTTKWNLKDRLGEKLKAI